MGLMVQLVLAQVTELAKIGIPLLVVLSPQWQPLKMAG